ncbi:MAG: hypothetical protein SOZ72_04215 [Treponema sp.]|nr:hypothetical protein [Treponema sp.]
MARKHNPVNDYLYYDKNESENFKKDDLIPFLTNLGLYQFYMKEIDKEGIDSLDEKQKKFLDVVIEEYHSESGKERFKLAFSWKNDRDVEKCKKIINLYEKIFNLYGKENVFNPVNNNVYTLARKVIKASEYFNLFADMLDKYTYELYTSDYDRIIDFFDINLKEVFTQFNILYKKISADFLTKIDKLETQNKKAEILYFACFNTLKEDGFFEEKTYTEMSNAFNELLNPNIVRNKVNTAEIEKKLQELRRYEFSKVQTFMQNFIKNNDCPESLVSEVTDYNRYSEYYYIFLHSAQYYIAGEEIIPSSDISKITSSMQDIVIKFQNLK